MWKKMCYGWMLLWTGLSFVVVIPALAALWFAAILLTMAELPIPKAKRHSITQSFGRILGVINESLTDAVIAREERINGKSN